MTDKDSGSAADIEPKRLAVVGATGSIGQNTLDIVRRYPSKFRATIVTGGSRVESLAEAAVSCGARLAVIADTSKEKQLARLLEGTGISVASGPEAIAEACKAPDVDMAVIASVGYSGLRPTVTAVEAGKEVALANKETLVVAGSLVMNLVKKLGVSLAPIDSEHSAVAQCLAGEDIYNVSRLLITASGGPFRTWPIERIASATAADALRHPNWKMGAKITIDSATMLNKAFELIEAHWLFGIDFKRIVPVVHPQSVIHSMVEFSDGSIKAQMGVPDMRLPISYALGLGQRLPEAEKPLDLLAYADLTFEAVDSHRFPCITLAAEAMNRGGNAACVINAANEIAVASFIDGQIGFCDIYSLIIKALDKIPYIAVPSLEDFQLTDAETRQFVRSLVAQSR